MNDTIDLAVDIEPTDPKTPLELEVWIDDKKIYDRVVDQLTTISYDIADDDSQHELKFVLKNKQPQHTKIDSNNNIISDALLEIKNIRFDGIQLGHTFFELTKYCHNHNNTGPEVQQPFFGSMGCNGTVSLKFTTPIYLWLLENM